MTTGFTSKVQIREVKPKEDGTEYPIGEHYRAVGIPFDAAPGETNNHDFSFPYPIALLAVICSGHNVGDKVDFQVAPDTVVGAVTQDVSASDTVINVQDTVTENVDVGDYVTLDDGTNDEEHLCVEKDEENHTITLDTGVTNAYEAATPTYVKITKKMGVGIELGSTDRYELGQSKIGGSFIPANTTIRVRYTNNGGSQIRVRPTLEILY